MMKASGLSMKEVAALLASPVQQPAAAASLPFVKDIKRA
jgi:hypothetical protein